MTRTILASMIVVASAACGGSSGKDLSNFTGATWNGSLTTTVTCGTQAPQTSNGTESIAFSASSGADFQYSSQAGCLFKFDVSGTTASLSNSPVTCSATSNGTVVVLNITSYQLSTSDGHHLTSNAAGTGTSGGQTCSIQLAGSGTR